MHTAYLSAAWRYHHRTDRGAGFDEFAELDDFKLSAIILEKWWNILSATDPQAPFVTWARAWQQLPVKSSRRQIIDEGGGTTLLDNVMLQFGSNMFNGDSHDGRNLPMILAGGGGGSIRTGRVLDFSKQSEEKQRACNLYVSLAQRMGLKIDRFGDSVQPINSLS